jgi:hypothetical protein
MPPGNPTPISDADIAAYLGTSAPQNKQAPVISDADIAAYLKTSVTAPKPPSQGIGSLDTLKKLALGFDLQPNHGMFTPKPQQSVDPGKIAPSDYTANISRGANRGLTPLTGDDIKNITAGIDEGAQSAIPALLSSNPMIPSGVMAHGLQTANAFTGGLGSTLLPKTFGQIQQAGDTGSPFVNEVLSAGENVLPYLTPAGPVALGGAAVSTGINVAEGNESLLAGGADLAMLTAGLKGFKAAATIEKTIPRLAATVGVSNAMYNVGQAIHGEPVTVGGEISSALTAVPFVGGHGDAPAEASRPQDTFGALKEAIGQQETNSGANNVPSSDGALGYYQILPKNIPQWSRDTRGADATGKSDKQLIDEYKNNVDIQKQVGEGKLQEFHAQALNMADGDPTKAAQLTARKWFGGKFTSKGPKTRQYEADVTGKFQDNLSKQGGQNATNTGNQPENSQQEHSGTFEGAAASANGEEVGGEASTPSGHSDSVAGATEQPKAEAATNVTTQPSPIQDENGIQIDQPVLGGQGQESVSGGNDEGSNSSQYRLVDEGVPRNEEDRTDNAEGRGSRPVDSDSNSGDESIRQGGAGEAEGAAREANEPQNAVNEAPDQSQAVEGVRYGERPILPEIARGDKTQIQSPTGNTYDGHYAVVDIGELTPSNNSQNFSAHEDYPPNVQDRDYKNSPDEQAKVIRNGNDLKPSMLINDSPVSDVGPPIVDSKGRVIGGNGRTMSTERAFASDGTTKSDYKATLVKKASQFGIDPEQVRGEKNPVLVRVMPDVELKSDQASAKLVSEMNLSQTTEKDATTKAIAAGRSLTPEQHEAIGQILEKHEELGDAFSDSGTNKQLIRSMEQANLITNENRPTLVENTKSNGAMLTDAGRDYVTNIMASRVLPDVDLARATAPAVRQKIAKAALPLAQAARYDGWSLEKPIREAVEDINAQKASGMNDADWRGQMSFDREPISREGEAMRNLLADKKQKPLRDFAEKYAAEAKADKGESSTEMFEKPERNPAETLVRLSEKATGKEITNLGEQNRVETTGSERTSSTNPRPGELTPSGSLSAAIPGADVLYRDISAVVRKEMMPALRSGVEGIKEAVGEVQSALVPSSRGEAARLMKGIMRENLSEFARKSDALNASFEKAAVLMDKLPTEAKYDYIDRMERGVKQDTQELEAIAQMQRDARDERVAQVQKLGTGKLRSVIENYFPHIWENPKAATEAFNNLNARRPFEGNKAWTKQRTIEYFKDGLAMGLKPVSDNPIELTNIRNHQLDKFIMAHKVMNEAATMGLDKVRSIFEPLAPGEAKINDTVGMIYGNPNIGMHEFTDASITNALNNTIQKLGIEHERKMSVGRGRLGYAVQTGDKVATQFATGEEVLAHELGHALDFKYDLWDHMMKVDQEAAPIGKSGKQLKTGYITKELRALADQRQDSGHSERYVRNRYEKMAVMLQAYVHAPDLFKETAPNTYKVFHDFLDSHEELHELRDVKPDLHYAQQNNMLHVNGLITTGYHAMPEEAARLINNYLSPGLQQKSAVFRGYRALSNTMNQFQLGWSGFHAGFVTIDGMTSRFALGIYQGAHGHPLEGAKTSLTSIAAPIQAFYEGNRMMKEWLAPGSQGEVYGKMVDNLMKAGGRAKMDAFYGGDQWGKMMSAWRDSQGPIEKVLRAGIRLPFAATEKAMAPLQQYLIPRMKMGLYSQMAKFELENLGPNASLQKTRDALGKAWDSVDNRMGQLTYDNLFWDRATKDIAMASVRSLGWNLGTYRELGGGIVDWGRFAKNLVTPGAKADFTHRMSYTIALPAVAGLIGAVVQKVLTDKYPEELKDYFYPKNGDTDANGAPARNSLPTYMKDVYSYYDDTHRFLTIGGNPLRTVMNKLHPALGMVSEMLQNRDYYGVQIRNEDDPLVQQAKSEVEFALKSFIPFSVKGIEQNVAQGGMTAKTFLPMIGVTPAPRDLDESIAEQQMAKFSEESRPVGTRTQEQKDRTDAMHQAEHLIRTGDRSGAQELIKKNSNVLHAGDMKLILKQARTDPFEGHFQKLSLWQKMKVYEMAEPSERGKVRAALSESFYSSRRQRGTQEEERSYRQRMMQLGRLPYAKMSHAGITVPGQ